MTRTHLSFLFAAGLALGIACGDDGGGSDCQAGQAGCACVNGTCAVGLVCGPTGVCQFGGGTTNGTSGDETSGNETSPTSGDPTGDPTTAGGCQGTDGTINCPCLGDNSCQGDLSCDSEQTCVCLGGTPCGESDCVEDFQTDNRHCGTCGNACMTFEQVIGACTLGECAPTLSDCVPSSEATNCDAVCQAQGRTCVPQGCGNDTWVQYGSEGACEEHTQEGTGNQSCSDDLAPLLDQPWMRCCCTP